jgi:hypothetical protein
MQEKGLRLGRTLGYRTGKFLSLATGGTVSAVALLMVLSPFAVGATFHAPYTGVVSKGGYASWNGCETNKGSLTFSLKTGIATGSAATTAKTCLKSLGQVGKYSSAYNSPSFQAAINFKVPSGSHHVSANWAINAAVKGSELTSGICPNPARTSSSYFYHYGSYYYWYNNTGANQFCSADASVYAYVYAYVQDLTSGQQLNFTYAQVFDNYMDTYNQTYWNCYNDTVWNGTAYSYSHGCYGYNTTTRTSAYLNGVYYSSWTGPTSFNNTTSMAKSMYFNNTYFGTHHYILVVQFYLDSAASVETWHAVASSSVNMATLGNSAKLVSIVVT